MIAIHWHDDSQPVYSVNFGSGLNSGYRLATGGGDNNIRIWRVIPRRMKDANSIVPSDASIISVEYLSTLRKHTQAVNCCRFSPGEEILATAGDDGAILLWKLADHILKDFDGDSDGDPVESWQVVVLVRSSMSEIYDLCWSSDGKALVAGSMDNSLSIFSVQNGPNGVMAHLIQSLKCHTHYVQGVSWDPRGEFIASQSADRLVLISKCQRNLDGDVIGLKPFHRFSRAQSHLLYHTETLPSFFRRLSFSPDGSMLITPAGVETDAGGSQDTNIQTTPNACGNTVYVFARAKLDSLPIFKLLGFNKPAVAIAFNPILYKTTNPKAMFNLPYYMIFAVATQDSILLYSTADFEPIGITSNLHYSTITDIAWYPDGSCLLVSSADGFCSVVNLSDAVLGAVYTKVMSSNDQETLSMSEKQAKKAEPTFQNIKATSNLDNAGPTNTID